MAFRFSDCNSRWRWAAKPVITSSSDEKLARAKQLGAVTLINYKTTPEWDKAVLEATGGGVQQALEVGGKQTLGKTLASLAPAATSRSSAVSANSAATFPPTRSWAATPRPPACTSARARTSKP